MKHVLIKSPRERIAPVGRITIRSYKAGTLNRVEGILARIKNRKDRWIERGRQKDSRANFLIEQIFSINLLEICQPNLVMQGSYTGKDQFIKRLIGDTTYSASINYGAIGSSSTPVAVTDTQLGAEVARVIWSTAIDTGFNQATFQFFFPDSALADGTYNEFGTFVDGTASANTGKIFNHALFASAYVKAAGTDTTVQVDITLT